MVHPLSQLLGDVPEIQDANDPLSVVTPNKAAAEVTTTQSSLSTVSSVRPILNLKPVPEIVKPRAPSATKRPHKVK